MLKILPMEDRVTNVLIFIILILFMIALIHDIGIVQYFRIPRSSLQNFSTIFISILLEAIPFIMLGAFISSIIQVLVSEDMIARWIPKNIFIGLILASLMGLIFPVCECAIVPIVKRLIKKGVPVSIAVTFMLAAPIINPIVLLSTYYAFYNKPSVVLIRAGYGLICAIMAGIMIGIVFKNENVILTEDIELNNECYCGCGSRYNHQKNKNKLVIILNQANTELYNIGKYLIVGAFLSATFQTVVPRNFLTSFGENQILSVVVMIILAFFISICSSADAFIAKSFLGQFAIGSLVAFLIMGPMIDLKNTLMLSGTFKKGFVVRLIIYIFFLCLIVGTSINILAMLGGI
ncbi:permease [Clostridium sp. WILCCON 0269]|uniref:Permease n=1 Tax=Candidatus Clostridium eludens TaxID=3381663 RepID=A0ABW8SP53_9CLOT